ncbi:FAD-dependent oxidoreductase [Avibacterium paragallinarum]|uniref:FAD-dependent oxidoreductase n=1 Tax=Avibacterium paragallinarum TaxID=728 RepID=UPI000551BD2F|nr:FAD-dependent oxidoreductase [Avibacterium paragallinarum]AZI15240.1 2-octaprenyl-3-methyl-6-methoxy-1,4-benzoquinol hydroxylase [Avibacterium paragallinarum]QIR12969.1 2-octaprenyl-3-methyl-6-methoxy-1,4-benzoquinol hydroxylase [Avibacterium paragallinarum]QJE10929.1 2-octaprenyl-3-methyl-6-methoxy-1,4-benzoquinol hydroxylase [Avibacterium paragallinarum]QJE13124.1 2-octaprenyl-3-methyl-6-methoxy-1,4-benzoquinol hydroxylase [Avibacterium paragallinarum]QJE15323.1 2-octaprenyl-3-methyl-6-me
MENQKDIIIVGGGMVGAACAVGLGQLGLNVHLIEASPLPQFHAHSPYDLRISAISLASVQLLQQLQSWQFIEQMRVCPYRGLETWEIEGFATRFRCEELGYDKLGYMVENNVIQLGLWQALSQLDKVQSSIGVKVQRAEKCGQNWQLFLDNGEQYSAPLVIAADGANSQFRQLAGIGITGWQYRQDCLLMLVDTELPQQDTTWQQFFPSGPRALLPLTGQQACLVWYDSPEKIKQLKQLSKEKLTQAIEQAFPARLGKINVQQAGSFALTRRHAQQYFKQGIVLVGDAAHTINPLAGQGVNLGFKDVKALLSVIQSAVQNQQDFSADDVLKKYQDLRLKDNLMMQSAMDLFYKGFKTELLPVKALRNLALLMAEKAIPLKKHALKYALGLIK